MQIHLEAIDAFNIVTRKRNPPLTPNHVEDEVSNREYRKLEAKARGCIQGACSEPVKMYLAGITTEEEMWIVLHNRMNSTASIKGRLALRRQFRDTQPVPGRPLSEVISRLHAIRFQLATTKQSIDDETFKDHLLTSLPSSYNNLVEIINEREDEVSVEEVIRKVQQSEMAKGKAIISANTSAVSGDALYSHTNTSSMGRGRGRGNFRGFPQSQFTPYGKFPGTCNKCGENGHRAFQCQKQSNVNTTIFSRITCFGCGENGHGTKHCPHQSLSQDQAANGREALLRWKSLSTSKSTALITATTGSATDISLLPDPGSSSRASVL
jgi:hypothetical protein